MKNTLKENRDFRRLYGRGRSASSDCLVVYAIFDLKAWTEWPDATIRGRQPEALAHYREELADKLTYHRVTQFFFFQQWLALKAYANDHHIEIVGDMPIYVAEDSSDMKYVQDFLRHH